MAIFAMHKRTPKKSGGRQPAVGASNAAAMADVFVQGRARQRAVVHKPRLQMQCAAFSRFEFACRVHSTGGLRPPLLVACTDAVADGRFSPTRVAMVPRNSGSSPGSEAGFVRFSPRKAILFPRGLTPPLRMYRARSLQRQRERCAIPVHASGERRLHAVGKCVSTAQDVDLNCSKTGRRLHAVGKCVSTACRSAIGELDACLGA
jgi:hypothetical protein